MGAVSSTTRSVAAAVARMAGNSFRKVPPPPPPPPQPGWFDGFAIVLSSPRSPSASKIVHVSGGQDAVLYMAAAASAMCGLLPSLYHVKTGNVEVMLRYFSLPSMYVGIANSVMWLAYDLLIEEHLAIDSALCHMAIIISNFHTSMAVFALRREKKKGYLLGRLIVLSLLGIFALARWRVSVDGGLRIFLTVLTIGSHIAAHVWQIVEIFDSPKDKLGHFAVCFELLPSMAFNASICYMNSKMDPKNIMVQITSATGFILCLIELIVMICVDAFKWWYAAPVLPRVVWDLEAGLSGRAIGASFVHLLMRLPGASLAVLLRRSPPAGSGTPSETAAGTSGASESTVAAAGTSATSESTFAETTGSSKSTFAGSHYSDASPAGRGFQTPNTHLTQNLFGSGSPISVAPSSTAGTRSFAFDRRALPGSGDVTPSFAARKCEIESVSGSPPKNGSMTSGPPLRDPDKEAAENERRDKERSAKKAADSERREAAENERRDKERSAKKAADSERRDKERSAKKAADSERREAAENERRDKERSAKKAADSERRAKKAADNERTDKEAAGKKNQGIQIQ
ncbi:unnamed protein product [Urochloa humidicola]